MATKYKHKGGEGKGSSGRGKKLGNLRWGSTGKKHRSVGMKKEGLERKERKGMWTGIRAAFFMGRKRGGPVKVEGGVANRSQSTVSGLWGEKRHRVGERKERSNKRKKTKFGGGEILFNVQSAARDKREPGQYKK